MIIKTCKLLLRLATVLCIFLLLTLGVHAAGELRLQADRTDVAPQGQVKVTVTLTQASETAKVLVKVSRGGVVQSSVLKNGLPLKDGKGEFVYIAPTRLGAVDILVIDPATNNSAKLSLNVVDEPTHIKWKKEYARITNIKGNVAYKIGKEEKWNSALQQVELHEGDSIRTWDKSWVTLQLFDGSQITLEPWTTVYIKFLQSSIDNAEVKQSVFKLFTGNVICKVKQYIEKGSKFAIENESTAAGVRGTSFEYVASMEGDTELIVYDGSVIIESLLDEVLFLVQAGQRIVFPVHGVDGVEPIDHNITSEAREAEMAEDQAEAAVVEEEKSTDSPDQSAGNEDTSTELTPNPGQPNAPQPTVSEPVTEPTPGEPTTPGEQPDEQSDGFGLEGLWNQYKPDKTNFVFGSLKVEDMLYLAVALQPEYRNILGTNLSFGLNVALYQNTEQGDMYFGSPDRDVILANLFNWAEYDGKFTYLRYGYLDNITLGQGLLFGNYSKENARGFQLGLDGLTSAKLGGRVLLPFDVKSILPWKMESTSSLYAARLTSDLRILGVPLRVGQHLVHDLNADLKVGWDSVPTSGFSADLSLPLSTMMQPYIEIAHLNGFGSGSEIGVKGTLMPRVWYQTGFRMMSQSFVPNYFGEGYEEQKQSFLTPGFVPTPDRYELTDVLAYPAGSGLYLKAGADWGWARFNLGYENYSNRLEFAPIVTAELVASTPKLGNLPQLAGGFTFKQRQFGHGSLFNQNTSFQWYVALPIQAGVSLTLTNTYIPADGTVRYTRELGISMPF